MTGYARKKTDYIIQILIIMTVIFAFMSAACINKLQIISENPAIFIVTAASDLVLLISWCWIGSAYFEKLSLHSGLFRSFSGKAWGSGITLVYCFATRVVQLGDTPRWDALTYYRVLIDACENFDFTISSFLNGFSLAYHPTLAYAGLAGIGEFLLPGDYKGVLYVQLILNLIMAWCLYKVLLKILPKCSWIYHTLASCVVLSTPLVLGTFSYFQPDAGTVYFFVFFLYCYLYKRSILMFFSMLLLVQTKEIGIVILAGFIIGVASGKLLFGKKEKSIWKRILDFLKEPLGISIIIAVITLGIYFVIFLKNGGIIWNIAGKEGEGFSTFSFQPVFMVFKWKQFFIMNFNWIIWGAILLLSAVIFLKNLCKRNKRRIWHREAVLGIFCAALIQVIFYCIYITYTLPRYHVLIDFSGVLLLVILVGAFMQGQTDSKAVQKVRKKSICYAGIFGIGMLLLLEAYTTIDPVSLAVFRNETTGNGRIIYSDHLESAIQRDFCVYNHQYTYLNKAYDHVLRDVGYHEGMDVMIWGSVVNDELFNGAYNWDMEEQKRTLKEGDDIIPIRGVEREMVESGMVTLNREAVFVLTPQFIVSEDYAENYLEMYYEIRYKGHVDVPFGGRVIFYVCDLIRQVGAE